MRRRTLIFAMVVLSGGVGWAIGSRLQSSNSARINGSAIIPDDFSEMRWNLTDQFGRVVTQGALLGRPSLVFFGFTHCPDVCPTTLIDIASWQEALGNDADRLNVVLITVDPERDTPDILGDYVEAFDRNIIALTGDPSSVAEAAAAFRVTYRKVPDRGGGYVVDHTSGVFLYGSDGRFRSVIDFHEDRSTAIPKIRRILEEATRR
jgi:protein SCO1